MRAGVALLVLALAFLSGCTLGSRTPRHADPAQELEARGFRIRAPQGDGWYLVQHEAGIVHFSKETEAAGAHTILAFVETADNMTPIEGRGALSHLAESLLRHDLEDARYTVRELRVSDGDLGRVLCERVDFTVEDRGVPYAPGEVFVMSGYELACPHPAAPRTVLVRIGTSQRYAAGRTPLPIDGELAPFLRSIRFTSPQ